MLLERFRKAHRPDGTTCEWRVDLEKCNGCGLCFQICPSGAIGWEDKRPKPVYIRYNSKDYPPCMGCRDCVAVCRQDAITIMGSSYITEGRYKSMAAMTDVRFPEPFGEGIDYDSEDLTETERVIYGRRSNRIFKKKKIEKQVIKRIIEAARYAPSAGNCRPWKFIVIEDQKFMAEMTKEVHKILGPISAMYRKSGFLSKTLVTLISLFKPSLMDIRPMYGTHVMIRDENPVSLWQKAPCIIVILGDKRGVGKYELDCGIAAQNMVLAAHAMGLGTCYIGFSEALNYSRRIKRRLGIKWPYRIVTAIALGYPKVPQDKVVAREVAPVEWF